MPDVFGASGQFSIDALNNQSQNTINNLFTGGGFGAQTDYYSGLGASYGRATGGFGGGGGGDASPYQTTPDVFSTGASGFSYPGAGGINWGSLSGGGGTPSFNPNTFQSPASNYDMFQGGWGNVGNTMPQGGAYQGMAQQIDWGNLFGGGGGGSGFTPPASSYDTFQSGWGNVSDRMPQGGAYQGMAKPIDWSNWLGGGETPQPQQQPINYGSLFGQGVGGSATEPYPPENTVADPNRATYGGYGQGGATSALPGYMGDNKLPADLRPSAPPEAGSRTYDFAPMFEGGGGGGATGTEAANSGSFGGDAFSTNPYAMDWGQDKAAPGPSADALAAQARARLADLISGAPDKTAEETAKTVEAPAAGGEAVPLPRERPAGAQLTTDPATDVYPGANPPRPPADIPGTNLTSSPTLKGVNPRLVAAVQGGAQYLPPGYRVEAVSGVREGTGQSYHSGGRAADFRIIGPDGAIPHKGADDSGMYTLLARGVRTWTLQNDPGMASQMGYGGAFGTQLGGGGVPDLMHYDLGGSRGNMVPSMRFAGLQPLSAEEQGAMPAYIPLLGDNQVALDPRGAGPIGPSAASLETRPGVNQGQDITPPPANIPDPRVSSGGFNALDAAANVPKGPSGVEKAQNFLNRPVESILQQYAPQHLGTAGWAMDIKQPLREALKGPFGSQILEGLQSRAGQIGLTPSDFNKAIANPAARFGGDFGSSGGDELPTVGAFSAYPGFRESTNFEDRRDEAAPGFFSQLADTAVNKGRDIADLFSSQPEPDAMSRALGFDDIMTAPLSTPEVAAAPEAASMSDFQSPANDYSMFQQDPSYRYKTMEPRIGADMQRQFEDYSGSFTPQAQQRQLQEQNAQSMQDLASNPAMLDNMLGMMLGEAGRGANASSERTMLAETIFNRAAQTGHPVADILNSGRNDPRGYYPDSWRNMASNLAYLNSHPEVRAQLLDELRTAGYGGSALSNLATHNASLAVGAHVPPAAVAAFGPVNQESFYNKSFPYSTTGVYQGDPSSTLRWYSKNAPIGQNTYGPLPGSARR